MEHVEVGGGTDGTILSKHAVNASKMKDGAISLNGSHDELCTNSRQVP